jgi:Flp pilus assembly protein TadB
MRVSYGTIITLLLIAYFNYCAVYLLLVLFFKLPMIVFFAVTIAVLSAIMYLLNKYFDEMFSRIEEEIEELMRHNNDNLER